MKGTSGPIASFNNGPLIGSSSIEKLLNFVFRNPESRDHLDMGEVSPLFTWQDSRCDEEFLATLPNPASNLRLATGYGCATIFWLQRHKPGNIFK